MGTPPENAVEVVHTSRIADLLIHRLLDYPDWMDEAYCAQTSEVDFMFGEDADRAVKTCETKCQVRSVCDRYAEAKEIQNGTWGGKNRLPEEPED